MLVMYRIRRLCLIIALLFNQNTGNWNVSKVVNTAYTFYNCTSFNQNISNWNVSNVTSMQSMFQNTPFNQDISNWSISRASNQNNTIFINNTAICKKKVPSKLQNNISIKLVLYLTV